MSIELICSGIAEHYRVYASGVSNLFVCWAHRVPDFPYHGSKPFLLAIHAHPD